MEYKKTLNDDYVDQATAGKILDLTQARISQLCKEGRLKGATKIGGSWIIPVKSVGGYTRKKPGRKPTRLRDDTDRAIWEKALREAVNLNIPKECESS